MGAKGARAFDNDAALDWLAELAGAEAVRETLAYVAGVSEVDFLDVDDGSAAIAAAAIVAAAVSDERDGLPPAVIDWLAKHAPELAQADVRLAAHAVERVLEPSSELRGLWDERDPDSPWHRHVGMLLERLRKMAGTDEEKPRRREPELAHEKAGLFAFLQFRGLHPSRAQKERIDASRDREEVLGWLNLAPTASSVEEVLGEPKTR